MSCRSAGMGELSTGRILARRMDFVRASLLTGRLEPDTRRTRCLGAAGDALPLLGLGSVSRLTSLPILQRIQ
jgi:hypothetical protein